MSEFLLLGVILGFITGWLFCFFIYRKGRDALMGSHMHLLKQNQQQVEQQYKTLMHPLRTIMESLSQDILVAERERADNFAAIREQIRGFNDLNKSIYQETHNLRKILYSSQDRGHWGEVQLERIVELAGMERHCDFSVQQQFDYRGEQFRPDMTIHLTGGRVIFIDAKTPFIEDNNLTNDEREIQERFRKKIRSHIDSLAKKQYSQLPGSCEFVIMFLPLESMLEKAFHADPTLLDYAFSHKIIPATPSSLLAILKSVALSWRDFNLHEEAQQLHILCRNLFEAISTAQHYFSDLGKQLQRSIKSFNAAIEVVNSQIIPLTNSMNMIGTVSGENISSLPPIHQNVDSITAHDGVDEYLISSKNIEEIRS